MTHYDEVIVLVLFVIKLYLHMLNLDVFWNGVLKSYIYCLKCFHLCNVVFGLFMQML
jgi:hypothetical protein